MHAIIAMVVVLTSTTLYNQKMVLFQEPTTHLASRGVAGGTLISLFKPNHLFVFTWRDSFLSRPAVVTL